MHIRNSCCFLCHIASLGWFRWLRACVPARSLAVALTQGVYHKHILKFTFWTDFWQMHLSLGLTSSQAVRFFWRHWAFSRQTCFFPRLQLLHCRFLIWAVISSILTSLECLKTIDWTEEPLPIQVMQPPCRMQKSAVSVKIKMFKLLSLCNQPLKLNAVFWTSYRLWCLQKN